MKYLWNRPRQNLLVIVRIKPKGKRSFTIPLSLWTLEETLHALSDFVSLCEKLAVSLSKNLTREPLGKWKVLLLQMPISTTLDVVVKMIKDLRKLGRFRMVEINDKEIQVYIDFY